MIQLHDLTGILWYAQYPLTLLVASELSIGAVCLKVTAIMEIKLNSRNLKVFYGEPTIYSFTKKELWHFRI